MWKGVDLRHEGRKEIGGFHVLAHVLSQVSGSLWSNCHGYPYSHNCQVFSSVRNKISSHCTHYCDVFLNALFQEQCLSSSTMIMCPLLPPNHGHMSTLIQPWPHISSLSKHSRVSMSNQAMATCLLSTITTYLLPTQPYSCSHPPHRTSCLPF